MRLRRRDPATGQFDMRCADCNIDTSALTGIAEYYHVHDDLWTRTVGWREAYVGPDETIIALGPGSIVLCIGCLETRLGRPLNADDFDDAPINRGSSTVSERLLDRLTTPPTPEAAA